MSLKSLKTKKEKAMNLCQKNLSLKNLKTKKEQVMNLCQKNLSLKNLKTKKEQANESALVNYLFHFCNT